MSAIYVDSIKDKTNTKTLATLSDTATTLHSDVGFPSGHIIKSAQLDFIANSGHISTTSSSFADTGHGGTITTKESSSNSRLEIYFHSGMVYTPSGTEGMITMTLTSSSNTTYAEANDLLDDVHTYRNHVSAVGIRPLLFVFYYNTSFTTPNAYPANLTSYSAGDTLYWRMFIKRTVGSGTFYLAHQTSHLSAHYYEFKK